MSLFSKLFTKPIYKTIDQYCDWLSTRKPMQAGAARSLLRRLVDSNNLRSIADLEEKHIAYFIGEELSAYFTQRGLIAIRGFLRYIESIGLRSISYRKINMETLSKTMGRPRLTEYEREVKLLRKAQKSFRQIRDIMQKKHQRPFYISNLHSWAKR